MSAYDVVHVYDEMFWRGDTGGMANVPISCILVGIWV